MAKVHQDQQDVEGFKLPSYFLPENFRMVLEYKPREGDHFVVGYPKCGTKWTQHILYLIFHDGQPAKNGIEFSKASFFVDQIGLEGMDDMPRPIIFKSHITYDRFPKSPEAKYIYICRNPKDCAVSLYYMLLGIYKEDRFASFANFFDTFMAGESFVDYFDHVLSWYNHRHEPNVLFLHYEEMKEDHRGSVLKIARFLGPEYETKMTESPEMLDNVVKYSSVEYMKNAKSVAQEFMSSPDPDAILKDPTLPQNIKRYLIGCKESHLVLKKIVRKGIVGDWRSHFTPEQNRLMDERIQERLGDTDIPQLWKRLGCI